MRGGRNRRFDSPKHGHHSYEVEEQPKNNRSVVDADDDDDDDHLNHFTAKKQITSIHTLNFDTKTSMLLENPQNRNELQKKKIIK